MAPSEATSADVSAGGEAEGAEEAEGRDYSASPDHGGMVATPLGPNQQGVVDEYDDETVQLAENLTGALETSALDCASAGQFRDAICDLATRICGIAADHPEHLDVAEKCSDGRGRCESARNRVDERCD